MFTNNGKVWCSQLLGCLRVAVIGFVIGSLLLPVRVLSGALTLMMMPTNTLENVQCNSMYF